ncbi:hypothetical protein [Actinophytocola sp.]|uniref:hypothetical protein n=1 Tax=Actinophytocola sp. TaxID=1872138 RepID=UPI002ED20064
MELRLDLGERQRVEFTCGCCKAPVERTWSGVYRGEAMHAVYFANCYHHTGQPHDTWLDVILGSFQQPYLDHVTFGCRVGPTDGDPTPGATLVDACMDGSGTSPMHGLVMTREQGLAHFRLTEFWQIVDLVLEQDPTVRQHLYQT